MAIIVKDGENRVVVKIQNISPHNSPFGQHEYEVRINQEVITTFTHKREEGLATCLRRAAGAVERAKWLEAQKEIKRLAMTEE